MVMHKQQNVRFFAPENASSFILKMHLRESLNLLPPIKSPLKTSQAVAAV